MGVSRLEGTVENGVIRLSNEVTLPEQTKVFVIVPDLDASASARLLSPRLPHPQQAREFAKQIFEVRVDADV